MSELSRCPGCGLPHPVDATSCPNCNFPLTPAASGAATTAGLPPAPETPPALPFLRPMRPPRPRPLTGTSSALWLFFGTVCAILVVFIAIKGFHENNPTPIEGSNEAQMKKAEQARAALAQDSTNVEARIALADVLYDTGNWSDAIVQYRAAIHRDSSRVNAMVDLGVCYFNLADAASAEQMFDLALVREPTQPVALFNLGIVAERRADYRKAFQYFHHALQAGGDENLRKAVGEAMERTAKESGLQAPPLDLPGGNDSLPAGHPPLGGGGK